MLDMDKDTELIRLRRITKLVKVAFILHLVIFAIAVALLIVLAWRARTSPVLDMNVNGQWAGLFIASQIANYLTS